MAFCVLPTGESYNGEISVDFDFLDGKEIQVHGYTEDLYVRSVQKEDIPHYQALFADPVVMQNYASGKTKTYEETAERVQGWIKRWQQGDPFSAVAFYNRQNDTFLAHGVLGYGDWLGYDANEQAGYSEMAGLGVAKRWNEGLGKQGGAFLTKGFAPELRRRNYLVETEFPDGRIENLPLKWIAATVRIDRDLEGNLLNPGSIKILTGLGFECKKEEEKYGHQRGFFGLNLA